MPTTTWQDLLDPGGATDFFSRREFPPFEPEAAAEYNHANALWLAELSRLVYRHDVEEDTPVPQPTRTSFLEKAGLKQHPSRAYIVVRFGFFRSQNCSSIGFFDRSAKQLSN